MNKSHLVYNPIVFAYVFIGGLILAACTNQGAGRKNAQSIMTEIQPTLHGSAGLADGSLQVQASLQDLIQILGPSSMPGKGPGAEGLKGAMPGKMPSGAMMGGGMGAGMPGGGMGSGGGMPGGGMPNLPPEFLAKMQSQARAMMVMPPRLILRIELVNTGKEILDVTILEVACKLGNYAPRPERVTLAPGQRVELEPMLSTSETIYGLLDLTFSIRQPGLPTFESCTIRLAAANPASN